MVQSRQELTPAGELPLHLDIEVRCLQRTEQKRVPFRAGDTRCFPSPHIIHESQPCPEPGYARGNTVNNRSLRPGTHYPRPPPPRSRSRILPCRPAAGAGGKVRGGPEWGQWGGGGEVKPCLASIESAPSRVPRLPLLTQRGGGTVPPRRRCRPVPTGPDSIPARSGSIGPVCYGMAHALPYMDILRSCAPIRSTIIMFG